MTKKTITLNSLLKSTENISPQDGWLYILQNPVLESNISCVSNL